MANRAELIPLIRQATVFKTTAEWVAALEEVGVPCGPINDLAAVFEDPQVLARGLKVELPHALSGLVAQVASPLRLSDTPWNTALRHRAWVSTPTRCWHACWGWAATPSLHCVGSR